MENKIYDVIIVGSGPAGLSAAVYASRYRLNVLVISIEDGGMVGTTHLVDNYLGIPNVSGKDLSVKFLDHLKQYENCEIMKGSVNSIQKIGKDVFISTEKGDMIQGKTLILALGTERKKANILREKEFFGKGVSYCTVCDGMFYKDKITAVVGSGDSALTGALHLSNIAKKIYLIIRKNDFSAKDESIIENVKKNSNIEILSNSEVKELKGNNKVEKMIVEMVDNLTQEKQQKEFDVDGFFVEIGSIPQSILFKNIGVECNEQGFIKINNECKTNIEGIYAAGDITTGFSDLRQIIIAGAMGAIAATSARKYLN